jgi:hypothetical protein
MGKKDKKDRAPAATASPETGENLAASGGAAALPAGDVKKVEPRLHVEHSLGPDPVMATAATGVEKLRENWQVIAAGLLVLIVAILFVTWRIESGRARNRLAWEELKTANAAAEGKPPAPDKLNELRERYRGTTAEPFIVLRIGDYYSAQGDKDNLGKAVEQYKRVLDEHGSNDLAAYLARKSIEGAERALAFDPAKATTGKDEKTEWAKGEAPADPAPKNEPPSK